MINERNIIGDFVPPTNTDEDETETYHYLDIQKMQPPVDEEEEEDGPSLRSIINGEWLAHF